MAEFEADGEKRKELTEVYNFIVDRLGELVKEQIIDEYTKITIIDMTKKVMEHLAKKYSNVKKGLGEIMGGKILDHPAKDILNQGKEEMLLLLISRKLEKGKKVEEIAEELETSVDKVQLLIGKITNKS